MFRIHRDRMTWAGAVVLLTAGAITARADQAAEVGGVGDPTQFEWTGCATAPREDVVRALRHDVMYQVASTPSAPRAELLTTLRQRLEQGYWHSGFPDASVRVEMGRSAAAADQVRVIVKEGPRFLCGGIALDGLSAEEAARFKTMMTTRQPRIQPSKFGRGAS